jgi:pilus assembly protein CpaC
VSVAPFTRLAVAASVLLALTPARAQTSTPAAAITVTRPATAASGAVLNAEQLQAPRSRAKAPAVPVSIEMGPRRVMAVGDVQTITLQDVTRIAIGNGALIKATVVDNSQIVLLAEAPGQTTMHVWLRNGRQLAYDVTVQAYRASKVLDDMQTMLKETPSITARTLGERIVLEGRYPNSETALKFKRLTESMPELLNLIADKPADVDPLQTDRMVQIDLRVIEVKKRALEQLGIKWASTATGPTFATNALGYANTPWRPAEQAGFPPVNTKHPIATYLGLATQITSALQFLEQAGDAWTLAEPRLSCKSGGEASFLAGGEIPIPVPQGFGAVGVEYKQYGVRIDFKPRADGEGNIDSGLMVEVSDPDTRNSNGGFVAFTTNRTQTQVAMKQGEPLVISGLLRQRNERSGDALPLLGRIPLISLLFGSRERTTEQTELFVIATPRVVTPDSTVNRDGVEKSQLMRSGSEERSREQLDKPPLLPELRELQKAKPSTFVPREN